MSLRDIVEEVKAQLQGSVTSQGACFGSLLTDFKLSSSITSLEVWRSVDEAFTDTIYQAPWQRTARVLMTATIDEPAITNAQTTGLIDSYIHKPFKLSDLRNAVVTSILGRMV
jgi:CheY-like chemotaxis protein